jgi:type IV secretory pathway VirB10-like protein
MTDYNEDMSDEELNGMKPISDEPILQDNPRASKWPWFLAAIGVILVVLMIQFGARMMFSSLTDKTKSLSASHAQTSDPVRSEHDLPMPEAYAISSDSSGQSLNVGQYLQAKKTRESDELARLRLLARLHAHEEAKKQEESMIQSSALVSVGVGVQNTAARNGGSTDGRQPGMYQNSNTQYLKSVSGQGVEEVNATMMGDLRFRILKGKVIQGVTESAIDSDLPGLIRGHVTEDVYGAQGDIPLIHNGDELIGEYRSGDIKNGQTTLYTVWTRLRLQSGITVNLDSSGSDPLGRAGMSGPVDHHYLERYGSAILMSSISAGAALVGVNGEDRYNSVSVFRQSASASFAQTASSELQQNMAIQNSIRPPQGTPISIMVNKDISFEDVLTQEENP